MVNYFKQLKFVFPTGLLLFFFSCATIPVHPPVQYLSAYIVNDDQTFLSRYLPVFVIENDKEKYNRIGTPTAKIATDGKEHIYVDPEKATVYTQIRKFETSKSTYTNLVYRIHFEKIPGGFFPFYLGKGKNIGLIVIVTLNRQNDPILYTLVHTCGCYLAFVPTSYLPVDSFPDGWEKDRQSVYFESLPGFLDVNESSLPSNKMFILIRDGSHRVKDIWLSSSNSLKNHTIVKAELQPLISLEKLALKDHETTSFYETAGLRKGYVKGAHKCRERLLMSWWALDWRIGEDKIFGKDKNHGIVFYTSLKPWDKEASDMRDFTAFLKYWKWNL
ncbi:MAG: hypothetical protein ABIJ59_10330 [Pseudomonadota bacterium]